MPISGLARSRSQIIKGLSFQFLNPFSLSPSPIANRLSLWPRKRVMCMFSWFGFPRGEKEFCLLNVHRPILGKDYNYHLINKQM